MPRALYGPAETRAYLEAAPHLKHPGLRSLFRRIVTDVFTYLETAMPHVLDLGAGEGSATIVFLEEGARVTAVDDSENQLEALRQRTFRFRERLEISQQRADAALRDLAAERFDVVAAVSFLHHVPDYLAFTRDAATLVAPGGVFLSFQDPLLYRTLSWPTLMLTRIAYDAWRVTKGDVAGGVSRRLRRRRGVWDHSCPQDVIEYHATREGVDLDAVVSELELLGFDCRVERYFSTQSRVFQRVGELGRMKNTFSIVATNDRI
jgi:SAM-dependent methyltransferase